MTIFTNLQRLDPHDSMYTAYVGDERRGYDEFDAVLLRGASGENVEAAIRKDPRFVELYGADAHIALIVDVSSGDVVLDRR